MADQAEVFEAARAVTCPACGAEPGQPCAAGGADVAATVTHGARILEAGVLPEPLPVHLGARLAAEARDANDLLWRDVLPQATRRLFHDPLLVARARVTAGVIRADRQGAFARDWSSRDQHLAEWAAGVALVVAERPELITGEAPSGRPPAEVLAEVVAPLVSFTGLAADDVATKLLQALELAGHEVVFRADRFASLERDDGRQLRLPLRGTCGICHGPVTRQLIGGQDVGEVLVGGWGHAAPGAAHDPARVVAP